MEEKTLQIDKKVFLVLFMFDHKKHTHVTREPLPYDEN